MTRKIIVRGPASLMVGASDCTTLTIPGTLTNYVDLGMSQRGVQISIQTLTHRVSSDDMGGQEGAPAEFLIMGATGRISMQLVKYNTSALATIRSGLNSPTTEGLYPLPGTPLFDGSYGMALLIQGVGETLWFPRCELATTPREFNVSSTEMITSVTFNAYGVTSAASGSASGSANGQVLYVASTTGGAGYEAGCADAIGGSVTT